MYCPASNYLPEQISKYKIIIFKLFSCRRKKYLTRFEYVTEYVYKKHWQSSVKYFQDSDM